MQINTVQYSMYTVVKEKGKYSTVKKTSWVLMSPQRPPTLYNLPHLITLTKVLLKLYIQCGILFM